MGALWQWWLGFAPRVGEQLLTWSWHLAALVVVIWVATMLLRPKHARVRGALWLAALLLIPLLPTMARLSPLPSTSVAELASSVRPAKAPAPPAPEPALPLPTQAASLGVAGPAAEAVPPVETVSAAAEAVSAAVPEPMVAGHSDREPRAPAFWRERRFWIGSAVLAWALIAAARLARVLASLLWIRKLVRSAGAVGDARLAQAFATACAQIGVSNRVELLSSDLISVPVTVGVLRPAVIVPRDLTASGRQGALDHVLYHELAHVRRRDAAVTLYRRVLEAVLFFHPLLWFASRRYEVEQEHICDDWALAALGDRGGYARALSELAAQATHAAPVAALGFAHRPSIIRLRVTRVLEETGMPQPRLSRLGLLSVASVSLLVLALTTSFPLFRGATEVVAGEGQPPAPAPSRPSSTYDIHGTVVAVTQNFSEEGLAKVAASESMEECEKALRAMWSKRPAANVAVTLRGGAVTREAVTDAEGKFTFTGLLGGDYELSAETPAPPSWTGVKRQATATERGQAGRYGWDGYVTLELRADRVSVRGRITDVDGRPVAGAKVTTVFDDPVDAESGMKIESGEVDRKHGLWVFSHTRSTLSNADGSYELRWLDPTDVYRIMRGLANANALHLEYVNIHVAADGFFQRNENVPRVPLVTEELLRPARALLKAMSEMAQRTGGREVREKEGLPPFPSSHGDTITGIDIVLEPGGGAVEGVQCRLRADKATWKEGEVPTLKADVHNAGTRELGVAQAQELCELQFDGRWYRWLGDTGANPRWFPPGKLYEDIPVSLVNRWGRKSEGQQLNLTPGKHTVVIAFVCEPHDEGGSVRVESNPVEVEILAPEAAHGAAPHVPAVTPGGQPSSPAPAPTAAATATEMVLKHDDGTMEGKRSLGASGHFVQFQCPGPGKWYLTEVQVFGSRYGSPEPPPDSFTITLCDGAFKTVKSIKKPYAIFERGDERWFRIPVPPLELPEIRGGGDRSRGGVLYPYVPFWLNVAFNPSETKGVYVGYDTSDTQCFSKVGLPDQTPEPAPDNGDWMIRLVITQNPPKEVAPELGAWVEAPKPARSWQEEGLVELKNDDGKSDGKLSMSGVGPAVRFEEVPEGATLTRLHMYASRYGSGFDPETTFADYYVFDDEKRILQTGRIPYSLFTYEEKWVDIPLEPVKVPGAFWVLINPQAHQSKGIYTHYDTDVQASHSKSGRIPEEMRDLEKKWDWMIRAYVQAAVVGRREPVPVVETELWRVEGGRYFIALSPDGKSVALTYRGQPPEKQYVLRDGKRVGGTYDILQGVTFSPDSHSLAFAAKSGDKWFMVRDGEALDGGHDRVSNPVFSPDSRSLAYAVTDGRGHFVLRDGERAGPVALGWAGEPVFSPDGRSLAFVMDAGRNWLLVKDGVAVPALGERIVSRPVFSPDSRSIAYVAESGSFFRGPCFLVKDGKRVGEEGNFERGWSDAASTGLNNAVFSPDGSSLAWVAPAGRKEFVIKDGVRASRDYDRVSGVAFGPDGHSLAFLASERARSIVIRDGVQVGPQYGNVVLAILYSPDGSSIAFKAEQGRRAFIVRDGMQVTPDYEQISNIVTSRDGRSMVFAAIRDRMVYRVEVPWAEAQPANGR